MSKAAESRIAGRKRPSPASFDAVIAAHADALTRQLAHVRERLGPPVAEKQLRRFPTGEAARLIGITDAYLRQLILSDEELEPEKGPAGRRLFTLGQINDVRRRLARTRPGYLRHRRAGEHLQVIAVTNVKGRSAKTTTAAHLAQYLALQGYRVLAVDLDPQAALSALFGCRPDLDVGVSQTLYGAVRRDGAERPLAAIVRPTFFPGLDLVPGHIELMACEHGAPLSASMPEGAVGRVAEALAGVSDRYDVVVVDCAPQLGVLTLGALCAATGLLVTVQPQMLDLAGMAGSLRMTADLLGAVREAGGDLRHDFLRYLVTRYEPNDGPQTQIVGLLRALFGEQVMTHAVPLASAIAEAGAAGRTLYEAGRESLTRQAYDRAVEALDAVNAEIAGEIARAWGRDAA
ncbi:chromosome partitioning protein ParA [Methylobacterium variabile]|jgi:chromosome partitioning protein|uniref:Chromosome partitioning protein ParA n=1 Tax=Methylobacterium variabile TaxID=298794 RepID=A0A0J6SFG3_9HYPH|nr:plasmid partitioning protein RepA [Methylobacterium variabile]KMO32414.1 chromosome partitioning protein ParA [Methylobacterium variabile]